MKKISFAWVSIALFFQSCNDKKVEQKINDSINSESGTSIYVLESKWKNQNGTEIQLSDLQGNVVVFTMMFTSCKSSCPKLVADVQRIEKSFNPKELEELNFVLCTIDPDYDTPERLKTYALEHELSLSHWTLITSSQDNIREVSAILGVKYKKTSPIEISHSNVISVFDKAGDIFYQQEGIEGDQKSIVEKINHLIAEK